MFLYSESRFKRTFFILGSSVACASPSLARRIFAFSHLSALNFSQLTSTAFVHLERNFVDYTRDPDFETLVAKVRAGGANSEIFHSLNRDETCSSIPVSQNLVLNLLHRFKDDWKSALGVFRWAESRPGFRPLSASYDMLVDILGKMKQMEMMRAVIEEMRENRLVTYSTIAKAMRRLAGAGKWEDAVRMFDELGSFGLEKNTGSMNILLDTLCKENKVEQARLIFLELKSHIPPNAHTFNIFIHGWCKLNRVDEALWTIQEMRGHGCRPCVISYSTIIQSYCRNFNFSKVYNLLDEMQAQGCPPNVVTFTTIMCSLTKSGEFEEALQIHEQMKNFGCKPDALFYNAMIHTLGRAGLVQQAIHVFEVEMPKNGVLPTTSTYNSMIAMFCHHGREEEAYNILRDMETSQHCKPDVQTFYPLLKSCFKSGNTGASMGKLLDEMVNKHHLSLDLSAYTLLIHGLCRSNKCEWAYMLFQEMIAQEITPRYQTCQLLLDEIRQKHDYAAADIIEGFMKKMKSSSVASSSSRLH